MRPKFQADADLNADIVSGVRRRVPEIDFQTANEADLEGVPDEDVLARAAIEGRILITHDRRTMPHHFARFIQTSSSPGVFIVRKRMNLTAIIDEIILIWAASTADEYANSIRRIPL